MDIATLITRKQQEADALAQAITGQQTDLDIRLDVIDRLHTLHTQSMFSTDDVAFLWEQYTK